MPHSDYQLQTAFAFLQHVLDLELIQHIKCLLLKRLSAKYQLFECTQMKDSRLRYEMFSA